MDTTDKDWNNESNPDELDRYRKDGKDLSATINQGQRISDLRELADLSIEQLAERCGITSKTLLGLEAGLQQLDPSLAATMAKHIGVGLSDLWVDDLP